MFAGRVPVCRHDLELAGISSNALTSTTLFCLVSCTWHVSRSANNTRDVLVAKTVLTLKKCWTQPAISSGCLVSWNHCDFLLWNILIWLYSVSEYLMAWPGYAMVMRFLAAVSFSLKNWAEGRLGLASCLLTLADAPLLLPRTGCRAPRLSAQPGNSAILPACSLIQETCWSLGLLSNHSSKERKIALVLHFSLKISLVYVGCLFKLKPIKLLTA